MTLPGDSCADREEFETTAFCSATNHHQVISTTSLVQLICGASSLTEMLLAKLLKAQYCRSEESGPEFLRDMDQEVVVLTIVALVTLSGIILGRLWKGDLISARKVYHMLAWVGEHGYDPKDHNFRFDLRLVGNPIPRACCGTMPNIVNEDADYSGFPYKYRSIEDDSVSPYEVVSTLAQCDVPLSVIRRLASIYDWPAGRGDWVHSIYRRSRPQSFDLLKKGATDVRRERITSVATAQRKRTKEASVQTVNQIVSLEPQPKLLLVPEPRNEEYGYPPFGRVAAISTGLGISLEDCHPTYLEAWFAKALGNRTLSESSKGTTTMEDSPPQMTRSCSSSSIPMGSPESPCMFLPGYSCAQASVLRYRLENEGAEDEAETEEGDISNVDLPGAFPKRRQPFLKYIRRALRQ